MSEYTRSVYERHLRIIEAIEDGESVTSVHKRYRVSRSTIYQLKEWYAKEGKAGLAPRSRAHHNDPHRVSEQVRQSVVDVHDRLVSQGWAGGARSVHDTMRAEGLDPPSMGTIHTILKQEGRTSREPRKRPKASVRSFTAALPNETWQSDYTHWRCADGTDARIQTWLDDHSRMVLYSRAFPTINALTVLDSFLQACAEHGVPMSTLTDNGREYTPGHDQGDRQGHPFTRALMELGVTQKNGKPGHPQTQGKIERWHRTLKEWLAKRPQARDITELQGQLDEFVATYNNERPHRALDGKYPHDVYHAKDKAHPTTLAATHGKLPTELARQLRARRDPTLSMERMELVTDKSGMLRGVRVNRRAYNFNTGKTNANREVAISVQDGIALIVDSRTGEILSEQPIDTSKKYQHVPSAHHHH